MGERRARRCEIKMRKGLMSKHLIITFKYKMKGNISKQISVKVTLFLSVESAICSLPVEGRFFFLN